MALPAYNTRSNHQTIDLTCRCCGTCCRKGGPGLHLEDRHLVETGKLPLKCLVTLRRGEPVYDNVTQERTCLTQDIIKIKDQENSRACLFFESDENTCGIYAFRPVECRALNCRDTAEIRRIYASDRLTRQDLLSNISGLWNLVEDHQSHCDYDIIKALLDKIRAHPDPNTDPNMDPDAEQSLQEIIEFDRQIRNLTIEKNYIDPELLDFIFGLPLTTTLKRYGLKIKS